MPMPRLVAFNLGVQLAMLPLKKFQLESFILKHDPLGAIFLCIIPNVTQLEYVTFKDGKLLMPSLLPTLIHLSKSHSRLSFEV